MIETLSEMLARKRRESGLSLRAVAKATSTGHVHLWEIETAVHSNPTIRTLAKLQDFYNISARELWAAARESVKRDVK